MLVSDAIAEILKREGVEFIVGYPVNPIIEAAARADIRTIIVRQERTGIHMADAFSRINSGDEIGVFVMQHGPGSENAFGGVAQAYGDSVPIIIIPAGYDRKLTNVTPNFSSLLNFQHVAKSVEQVTVSSAIPDAMRRAFSAVRNGRPRPAVIEIPTDVFPEEIESLSYTPVKVARSAPDPSDVSRAAEMLVSASNPVIYAGQGVHYAKAWGELKELAELLEVPVTTSLEGKSAFPETHPLALGSGGRALPKPVHHFIQKADVIFGIGCSFFATGFGIQFPKGKTVIHSTLDPLDLDNTVEVTQPLVGDAQLTLTTLIREVRALIGDGGRGRAEGIATEIASIRDEWLNDWQPRLDDDSAPLSPYRVIRDLHATVDVDNTIITHDAGSPRDQLSPFWTTDVPLSYIGWGKTTQLGYGLGLAMGAKLARPDKLCINVWGDAAIGFTGMDFETAVRENIPILSILFNNFSMAIELPIMQVAREKYGSTDISGNYADMAKAFGGYGERIERPEDIIPAIERGIQKTQEGTAVLLEFITQQDHTYSVFK
ncbi:MAG TPA: thiamine pyrophosphate-requiring protein [Dehalococcoidia bacterium]|nr:thiamine pyrophosphate-requiring protein [Dehalococcoidia bacterium]